MARQQRSPLAILMICAVVASVSGATGAAQATPAPGSDRTAASVTDVGGCRVFPRDNYWNTPITHLDVHPRSHAWMSNMSPDSLLHPDFGRSYGEQPVPYGIPITIVDGDHAKVDVDFRYERESDPGPYPLGDDTKIEGGRRSNGDRHAVIVDSDSCRLYETWKTRERGDQWYAGSGAVWSLSSHRLRRDGWTSADAAGLPILPGLLRLDEVRAGAVTHAIRFTTDVTQTAHVWPARHDAGSTDDPDFPPMGARFRLDADFPTDGYRSDTVIVLEAMKTYGLVLADNGTPWYFQGTAERGWPTGLLDELKTIPADRFEAVDTEPVMIKPNSGQARQP